VAAALSPVLAVRFAAPFGFGDVAGLAFFLVEVLAFFRVAPLGGQHSCGAEREGGQDGDGLERSVHNDPPVNDGRWRSSGRVMTPSERGGVLVFHPLILIIVFSNIQLSRFMPGWPGRVRRLLTPGNQGKIKSHVLMLINEV
jgi:hypothetical protein